MSEMRYANTKILIVTCYLLLYGQKRLRYAFVLPSLCLRYFAYCRAKEDRKYIGFTTEVQRNYILGSLKLSYNLIEACINSGDDYGMVFTFF